RNVDCGVKTSEGPMMIATVAAITTILASSPNPKLFVVQHSPYTDEARWAREMALIKELRFGGVRAGWGTGVVVAKEGRSLSQWGQKLVRDSLDRYKSAGLKLHLTLDSSLSNGA